MSESITVNGERRPYENQTVLELLAACGVDPDRPGIAVAVNAAVALRAEWDRTSLRPGDRVEIVQPKAGG